jgi:hypothetical protein
LVSCHGTGIFICFYKCISENKWVSLIRGFDLVNSQWKMYTEIMLNYKCQLNVQYQNGLKIYFGTLYNGFYNITYDVMLTNPF